MLKTQFKNQLEFDTYITEQNIKSEKGYLTRSEREALKKMQEKEYKSTIIKEEKSIGLPIITNINLLKKSCFSVEKEENISKIIQDLKDTLVNKRGWGLSANQIGYNKKISYIHVPKKIDSRTKQVEYLDLILVNPKIVEKDTIIKIKESCLSFPGVVVETKRYAFLTVEFETEKRETQTGLFSDIEALAVQHEIDHLNGLTIFDRKWRK